MAGAMDSVEGWETMLPVEDVNVREKHNKAIKMQNEIKLWMKRNNFMIETGISYPERTLTIYLPPGEQGEEIQEGLCKEYPGIEQQADFDTLEKVNRKRLAMYPGRTPIFFGDGSSATLGTFVRDRVNQTMYALTSQHSQIPVMGRDVFVKVGELMYRLGKVVADVKEPSPVVDACLVEVDVENEEMYKQIKLAMYVNDPKPPMYLKMYENAENLGIEDAERLQVSKYGYSTKITTGRIKEYSRDIVEDGCLLTDNIVTISEDRNVPFAAAGDSGSVVYRTVRTVVGTVHGKIYFYDAISMLYMADDHTGESFSIPLPRCLKKLGEQSGYQLELATQKPGTSLNP